METPDDSSFLQSLRFSCARLNGIYPPLALVEAYIIDNDRTRRARRLHLIIVDLNQAQEACHSSE